MFAEPPTSNGHATSGDASYTAAPSPQASNGHASSGVSVEAIEEQRARLEADVAAANARLFAAKHRAAELDAATKESLRKELAASRETLAEIDAQHAETVALIRRNAEAEVERILADARRRAGDVAPPADGTVAP